MEKLYKWYIIHTMSGSEKWVVQQITDQAVKNNMEEFFEAIHIPLIEVPEVKRGKAVKVEKKLMPGYILIKMHMSDESRRLVTSVPKITEFLGSESKPQSLSEKEVQNIFNQLESEKKGISTAKLYDIGERVTVLDGPFEEFSGIVEEVDNEKHKLKVSISIFGKPTPIELSFTQVRKN